MRIVIDGTTLRDEYGRQRILHGINMVAKGGQQAHGTFIERGFRGDWTREDTDLWSDAYLVSPALHEALDQFWANAPGPGGVGLQDRFAAIELFLFDVASTLYMISAVSYGYLAAPTREDRIDVEVVKSWVGNITSAFATIVATQLLVGDTITEHATMATILMGVVLINAAIYVVPALLLKDPPELYEKGDCGNEAVSWAQLKKDARSIVSMRAFWAWFAFGTTALAPMGMYFTAFLYFMDHVIRSTGDEATITDIGSMVIVLVLLPLVARLIKRVGSRTAIYVAFVPYLGGLAALFFVTQWWQVLISYIFIMTGRYMMTTAGVALEGALIDDNERITGTRKTGSFASLRAIMSAPIIGGEATAFVASEAEPATRA